MSDLTGGKQDRSPPEDRKPSRAGGKFKPGQSGNPAGRPRGSRNRTTELVYDLLGDAAEETITRLIAMAKGGDRFAMRLVVDRVAPLRRDRAVELRDVRRISTAADLVEVAGQVVQLAALGELTLEESRAFMGLLEQQRKAIEASDLAVRVQALEAELERERSRER